MILNLYFMTVSLLCVTYYCFIGNDKVTLIKLPIVFLETSFCLISNSITYSYTTITYISLK